MQIFISIVLISRIIFPHLPRPAPLRYPLGMAASREVSLKLKEGRETVAETVPVGVPDVCRGCGLTGPDRPSIRVTGAKDEGGTSPGLG